MRRSFRRLLTATTVLALALVTVAAPQPTQARPLDLGELFELEQYLHCAFTTCEVQCAAVRATDATATTYSDVVDCERCLADEGCGQAPRIWEKDGLVPVTWDDHDLAVLEQLTPGLICYGDADETIVRPLELCPGSGCQTRLDACLADPDEGCSATSATVDCRDESFGQVCWYESVPQADCPSFVCNATNSQLVAYAAETEAMCVDGDGDGVPFWSEAELSGGIDATPTSCITGDDCTAGRVCAEGDNGQLVCQVARCDLANPCGFFEKCVDNGSSALPTCEARDQCTADGTSTGTGTDPIGETCDSATGACVACIFDTDCGSDARCASGNCLVAERCVSSLDCTTGLVCDSAAGYCLACVSAAECGADEICTADGVCEASCGSDLDCTGAGQLCHPTQGTCVACVTDDTCDFGDTCVLGTCRPTECSDGSRCVVVDQSTDPAEAGCADLNCRAEGSPSGCTAFHLEKVAEDDVEVLVHVHYDFTPVPARVLDLYLNYDDTQLLLEDARPLTPLALNGKELASSHLSDGTLVLNVFDTGGTHPVPNGPIIELVFRRVGVCPTEVAFTDRVELREVSVAPLQGTEAIQKQLGDDRLWGDAITLCARSEITPRLRLWYGFEDLDEPLAYSNVPSAQDLCDVIPACTFEQDEEFKARFLTRLANLQAGELLATERIPGVTRDAVYLDGASDHLRTPVHFEQPLNAAAQSFSFSSWFYSEGNSANELSTTPQLLYSHNASNERTAFGVMAIETDNDTIGLIAFHGDLLDPRLAGEALVSNAVELSPGACAEVDPFLAPGAHWIAQGIPVRTWHHAAFTLDANYDSGAAVDDARLDFYFDGESVGCVIVPQPPDAVACPQLSAGTDVQLHDEGEVLGGSAPEFVYMSVNRSNLGKIERMDPSGLTSTTIIGDTEFSYRDPSYSPILDRLLYSTNVSGDWEIWIARGDGTNRRQITKGFGDEFRGITARRPRWAPDGSAIVFDSNIFDVIAGDNAFAFVRHIYFVGYDPIANAIAIELADNSITEELDYQARLGDQTISDYRLTSALDKQHRNARWLVGKRDDDPSRARGTLLIDTADSDFGRHRVQLLTIPEALPLATTASVAGLGVADEIRMIDAFRSERAAFPEPIVTERLLIQRENTLWEPDDQFALSCDGGTCSAGAAAEEIVLTHTPNGYDPRCWDANLNNVADADEDRNGDGSWDTDDCNPSVMDVFVSYDAARYQPVLDVTLRCTADRDCDGGQVCGAAEVCQLAANTAGNCSIDANCDAGEICDSGHCMGVVKTVLGCVTETDCDDDLPDTTCHRGQCYAEGDVQVACLSEADCPGGRTCTGQLCETPSDSGGLRACDQASPCDAGQRCELGYCKVLGRIDDSGSVTQRQPCLIHQDCVGGQICHAQICQATTGLSDCSTNGDADCEGGSLCVASVCVTAGGTAADVTPETACALQTECGGGQICDFAAGKCKVAAGAAIMSEQGDAIFGVFGKKMKLATRFATINGRATSLLRVQVLSPQSADPIGPGSIVTLRFKERGTSANGGFAPEVFAVRSHVELAVKDLRSAGLPDIFEPAGTFERIVDGAFSPDGDNLLLGAISVARPILLRTRNLTSALDAERVIVSPIRVDGLNWVRQARFYPCNWAGGYVHLQSKTVLYGWRGGLDDFKIHAGLRDPDAFRSEAERGREFLVQNDQDGVVDSRLPQCGNSHIECPPFHLCLESECQMVPCAPTDPWSCADFGGRCTLRPESVEQENTNTDGSTAIWDWVCAADCTTDNQCFTEECLNGPCRFCDTGTLTCLECRDSVRQLGAISISGIEGCPDQRSFACETGACVTDCYAFEDGQSIYLCDPTTEFCDAGRCVLLDWDWWDLAPASFAGLGAQRRIVAPDPANAWNGYTQAVDQRIPVKITAYGVEDWNRSPEMLVEVRGGPFYGSEWNTIGKISVHHRTMVQARTAPYTLTSPSPFNDLRLRLVTSPAGNPTGGATGLRERDVAFCVAAFLANVPGATADLAGATCSAQAQGSRYLVGYPVGLTDNDAISFCQDQGHAGCPTSSQGEHDFLQPGQPAIAVLDVIVDGGGAMNNITANKVCGYEGELLPVDNGAAKKITYGPFGSERSNQAAALRASCEQSQVPSDFIGLWTADGVATAEGDADDGVANQLSYAPGRVGQAFSFDSPADYLSPSPGILTGRDGLTVEAWVKTGDLRGGLVTIFSRPASCVEWKAHGRTVDASYTIWAGGRPLTVHCAGMDDPAAEARAYIDLPSTAPGANTSRYLAGGGSFGTPVETTYAKVRFDPATLTVDIGDQTFATSNGGRLGDGCLPADRADAAQPGCYVAIGNLEHLWRGENDVVDAASDVTSRASAVSFAQGRIGQALSFAGTRSSIVTGDGLPDDARGLTVEGWIKTSSTQTATIVRQASDVTDGGWEVGIEGGTGTLRFDLIGGFTDAGEKTILMGQANVADGQWHHIAVVLDATAGGDALARIWVDGALDVQVVDTAPWDIPSLVLDAAIVVGQGRNGARGFVGAIDDLGIWSKALDLDDILQVDPSVIGAIYAAGATDIASPGQGDGKCLPDETTNLPICTDEQIVTSLPLGVAASCMGPQDARASASFDLTGTAFAISGQADDVFTGSGTANVSDVSSSAQAWSIEAAGRCGYIGPTGWSGDPAADPGVAMLLPVRLLDDAAGIPQPCDADCRTRVVDELAVLTLNPEGMELRIADRVHQARKAGARLADHTWHHVAVVRAPDAVTVYVDGEIWLQTTDVPFLTQDAADLVDRIVIGQDSRCAIAPENCVDRSAAFSGIIDELAFYNRPLSGDEVDTIVAAGAKGRPLAQRPDPTCPGDDDGLLEFDRDLYGYALLNCNYYSPLPSDPSASIDFQNIVITREWPARSGAITFDNGDTCIVELDSVRTEPCYAWTGNDVSIDPGNDAVDFGSYVPFQTLEFGLFRSFGHDEGFERVSGPTYDLSLTVSGLPVRRTVKVGWSPDDAGGEDDLGNGSYPLASLAPDRRLEVHVAEDPAGYVCHLLEHTAAASMEACGNCVTGLMPPSNLTLDIYCEARFDVTVQVSTVLPELVIEGQVRTQGGASVAAERLTASNFSGQLATFSRMKPTAGQTVAVSVASPAGYVCTVAELFDTNSADDTSSATVIGLTGDVGFAVTCVTAPTFALEIEVAELATVNSPFDCAANPPSGVEVTDAQTGVTLCVDRDGVYTLAGANYAAGATWDLSITRQPPGPPFLVCALASNATGVMPDRSAAPSADFPIELLPRITCIAPTNIIEAQIFGLKGQIDIALVSVGTGSGDTDETVATQHHVGSPANPGGTLVEVAFAEAPLEDAIAFRVEVTSQPDNQNCTVTPAAATTPLPGGIKVLISCTDDEAPVFSVGGTVNGLTGGQLRLALNLGAVNVDVLPNETEFLFPFDAADLSEYSVEVDRQPIGQNCTVANGEGVISGTSITDVVVTCINTTIFDITVQGPGGFSTGRVKALLFAGGPLPYLAGKEDGLNESPRLVNGATTFEMPDPDTDFQPLIAGRTYQLVVFLSNQVDPATDAHVFLPGLARATMMDVTVPAQPTFKTLVLVPASAFVPTGFGFVFVDASSDATIAKDEAVACVWSPAGTVAPLPPFTAADERLVARSLFLCEDDDGCDIGEDDTLATGLNDALPAGVLDVTCWADLDNSNSLTRGDLWGRLQNRNTSLFPTVTMGVRQ